MGYDIDNVQLYGIYGFNNIKIIKKHEDTLKRINKTSGYQNYKIFKSVLDEIHNEIKGGSFFRTTHLPSHNEIDYYIKNFYLNNMDKENDFEVSDYYYVELPRPLYSAMYYILIVLKIIVRINNNDPLEIINMEYNDDVSPGDNILYPGIPSLKKIKESDKEFQDAYTIIRSITDIDPDKCRHYFVPTWFDQLGNDFIYDICDRCGVRRYMKDKNNYELLDPYHRKERKEDLK